MPEHVVVQRHTGVVLLARAPRQRELASVTDAGVTQIARVDGGSGQVPVLSAAQVARVVDLTLRSEVAIGAAADVEWAFDSRGQLWVVQARPITTLPVSYTHLDVYKRQARGRPEYGAPGQAARASARPV